MISRRILVASSFAAGATALLPRCSSAAAAHLSSRTMNIAQIGRPERAARLATAQRLMAANDIGAVLIEPGSSLDYFTGVRWRRSERLTCAILPVTGRPCIVTPFFEEPSVRESLGIDADVRVWQEDESPSAQAVAFLKSQNLADGSIGIEETVRFFASEGLREAMPSAKIVSANPVVRGCRMIKTSAEIALMQTATDITVAAINHAIPRIKPWMMPSEISAMINTATITMGGTPEFALVLLGEASSYPHGSGKPQRVTLREPILMDVGCNVGGYQSDVSRTVVLGGATDKQRRVFGDMQQGQRIAFAAAQIGRTAGSVDDAVRAYYENLGYGPRYKLPGLSHRTGHGIGMDGHEPVNLVHGETTLLSAGMCFSNEPGLYLPGEFGVRIEDCFHMTARGPEWFSKPQVYIDA